MKFIGTPATLRLLTGNRDFPLKNWRSQNHTRHAIAVVYFRFRFGGGGGICSCLFFRILRNEVNFLLFLHGDCALRGGGSSILVAIVFAWVGCSILENEGLCRIDVSMVRETYELYLWVRWVFSRSHHNIVKGTCCFPVLKCSCLVQLHALVTFHCKWNRAKL